MLVHAHLMLIAVSLLVQSTEGSSSVLSCDPQGRNCYQEVSTYNDRLVVGVALPPQASNSTAEVIIKYSLTLDGYGYVGIVFGNTESQSGTSKRSAGLPFSILAWMPLVPLNDDYKRDLDDERRIFTFRNLEDINQQFPRPATTLLEGTTHNATHLVTVVRCTNCLSYIDQDLLMSTRAPLGLIFSSATPQPIDSPDAYITFNQTTDLHSATLNWRDARFDDYFDRI